MASNTLSKLDYVYVARCHHLSLIPLAMRRPSYKTMGRIQILAAIFCPSVTCSNVPAIWFHNILINLQYNFQNLNDKHFSQMVLSTRN